MTVPTPPQSQKSRANPLPPSQFYLPSASDRVPRQKDRVVSQRYRDAGELSSAQNGNHTIVQSIEGPPLSPRSLRNLEATEQVRSQQEMQRVAPRRYSPIQTIRPNGDHLELNPRKRPYEDYEENPPHPQPGQLRYVTRATEAISTSRSNRFESFDRSGYVGQFEPLREAPHRKNYPEHSRISNNVVYISSSPTRHDTDQQREVRRAPSQAAMSRIPTSTGKRHSLESERHPIAIPRVPGNNSRVQAVPEASRYSTHQAPKMSVLYYGNPSLDRRQPLQGDLPTTQGSTLVRPVRYEAMEYLERPHERRYAEPIYEPLPAQSSRHAQPGLLPYSNFAPNLPAPLATTVQPLNGTYDGSYDAHDMSRREEPRKLVHNDDLDFSNGQR